MAKAKVQLPNGRIATVEIPDGMSAEEAGAEIQAMYDADPSAFGVTPQQQPTAQTAPQAGALPTQAAPQQQPQDQNLLSYLPHYQIPRGIISGETDNPLSAYGAGLREAGFGMVRGARQLFNKATGDEEELARLNADEEAARSDWDQRSAQHPIMAGAGKLVGSVGAPIAVGAAMPALGAGALGGATGLALRAGAGALAGGVGGAANPLTGEEEESGQRVSNAIGGAAIGGLVPVGTTGISKAYSMLLRKAPDDALADFAKRQLGASHEKGASGAYRSAIDQIDNKYKQLRDQFSQLYDSVEKAPSPPVKLNTSSRLGEEALNLPEEVSYGLSPTARRVAQSLQRGSTKTSPIVDSSGRPIQDPRNVSFGDVRETIRELRAAKRALPYTDNGIQQSRRLDIIIKNLDDDLEEWAKSAPEAREALTAARDIDSRYAKEVAPFVSKDEPIGKFRRSGQDERSFDRTFLRPDAGFAAEDLLTRVPESRAPLRELYGQKLMTAQGPTLKSRNLEGGTLGEKVLSPEERAYLKKVAESVRANGGSPSLVDKLMSRVGADRLLNGVELYGQPQKKPRILADMLRSYGASQLEE